MQLIWGFWKKNWLLNILYTIVFAGILIFQNICFGIGEQMHSGVGFALIACSLGYGYIVLTTMLKLQVTVNRNIWENLDKMGMLGAERRGALAGADGLPIFLAMLGSGVLSVWLRNVFFGVNRMGAGMDWIWLFSIVLEFLLGYFQQDRFLSNKIWKKNSVQTVTAFGGEGIPLCLRNVLRNRERMCFILGVVGIGIILFNSTIFLIDSDNSGVYLEKAIGVDYFLTGVDTREDKMRQDKQIVPEEQIQYVQTLSGVQGGGSLYHNLNPDRFGLEDSKLPETSTYSIYSGQEFEKRRDGTYKVNLYGADDFVIEQMEMIEGEADLDKLKTGKYILYGLERDATSALAYMGEAKKDWKYYEVGDQITLTCGKRKEDYEILGICVINHTYAEQNNFVYPGHELTFYLPSTEYLSYGKELPMRYLFSTVKGENIEQQLEGISYESRKKWEETYETEAKQVKWAGIIFAWGCAGIGIFVYANMLLVSYLDRRREFTILGNIGMTKREIHCMVTAEGAIYGGMIFGIGMVGAMFVLAMGKGVMTGESWNYTFTMWPGFYMGAVLVGISVILPLVVYKMQR